MRQRPILDRFELRGIQTLRTWEDRALVEHRVPGLPGSLFQDLGTEPTRITIEGSLSYLEDRQDIHNLETLRRTFQAGKAVPFVADITTATRVQEVVIREIRIRESERWPEYFDYEIDLVEHVPEPPPPVIPIIVIPPVVIVQPRCQQQQQPCPPALVANGQGRVEVTVELGEGRADYTGITVLLEGTTAEGQPYSAVLDRETQGVYVREGVPAGNYSVSVKTGGGQT